MLDIIVLILWTVSVLVNLLAFIFFIEILLVFFQSKKSVQTIIAEQYDDARAAILIPAHNEEEVIGETLASIVPQLQAGDEIVLVADNCTDNTRSIAASYPVTVLERHHQHDRGKGFALDFALEYIKNKSFDVVIMIDADCIIGEHCRDRLVETALQLQKPIQCLYLMEAKTATPTLSQKIAQFAWLIKNKLRPLGLKRLGGPCQLMGTGMAFPAGMLNNVQLASGCIVEDMKLGLDLTVAGNAPYFLPEVQVVSYFPENDAVAEGQKSRWIHGHMEMISRYTLSLLKTFVAKSDFKALLLCCDLLVPPLVLLLLMVIASVLITFPISFLLSSSLFVVSILALVFMGGGLALSWLLEGRHFLSLNELATGIINRVKSASIYVKFFTDRRRDWNKTSRK